MKLFKYLFIFCLTNNTIFAQGLSNNWLLGYWMWPVVTPPATSAKSILDFNTGSPIVSSLSTKMVFNRTQGNISDANGNLLISSNGIFIANAMGDTMLNGGGINPDPYVVSNYSSSGLTIPNGNLFLPFPGDSNKYILFHQSILNIPACCNAILYYSIIDKTLANGLGAVTQKNMPLSLPRQSGGIAACKHANGRDWWVIVEQDTSSAVWKLLITPQGISSISSQTFSSNLTLLGSESQACFSPDGTKFAFTTIGHLAANKWINIIRYFNFNRCSGNLSELSSITIPDTLIGRGLCFSPNSNYLYACSNKVIYQLNTDSINTSTSIDTVAVYDGFQGGITNQFDLLYRANNGKIYISTFGGSIYLGCINAPDSAGISCNVQQHSLPITCYNTKSVPNHPNYFLGSEIGSPCDTLLGAHTSINKDFPKLFLAPNPAQNELNLNYTPQAHYQIFELIDASGKTVLQGKLPVWSQQQTIDISELAEGIYLCRLLNQLGQTSVKFVKCKME